MHANLRQALALAWAVCLPGAAARAADAIGAIDGGGERAASGVYVLDASLGGFGGGATNLAAGLVVKSGYAGQNNFYKYVGDLDPTNPASVFQIVAVSNAADWRVYFPSSSNRTYTLCYTPNLLADSWTNVPAQTGIAGVGGLMALADTNAVCRFYRVQVHAP